jgi:uncharacterized protein (DUF2141 family)
MKNLILVITQSSDVDTTLLFPALTDRQGRVQVDIFNLETAFSDADSLREDALMLDYHSLTIYVGSIEFDQD